MQPLIYMRNTAEIALGTNIGFVTIDLWHDPAEAALGTNIGFVTTDLHTKDCRDRIGNEHRVCNHGFTIEILQKSHWERT